MPALNRTALRAWLQTEALLPPSTPDSAPLFSEGLLDSLLLIDLIGWIEKTAGVSLAWHEVTLENLDTIDRILAFLEVRSR